MLCSDILTAELRLPYENPIAKESGKEAGLMKTFSEDRMPLKWVDVGWVFSWFLPEKKTKQKRGLKEKKGMEKNEDGQLS